MGPNSISRAALLRPAFCSKHLAEAGEAHTRASTASVKIPLRKESQEYLERTEWHQLIAWGNLAKFATALKSRNHLFAEGELRYRTIPDKNTPKCGTSSPKFTSPRSASSTAANDSRKSYLSCIPTTRPPKPLFHFNTAPRNNTLF
jgi:single-stranded DNA-binding protein